MAIVHMHAGRTLGWRHDLRHALALVILCVPVFASAPALLPIKYRVLPGKILAKLVLCRRTPLLLVAARQRLAFASCFALDAPFALLDLPLVDVEEKDDTGGLQVLPLNARYKLPRHPHMVTVVRARSAAGLSTSPS